MTSSASTLLVLKLISLANDNAGTATLSHDHDETVAAPVENHDQLSSKLSTLSLGTAPLATTSTSATPSSAYSQPIPLASLDTDTTSAATTPIKKPRLAPILRCSTHTVVIPPSVFSTTPTEHILTSWKMADHAYKQDPCPFPTRARGLFTEKVEGSDEYRIVARGYDKFFNVDEVSWTMWDNISKFSAAPYELTHKANGCIILISALSPIDILVTSKHSLGPVSIVGEKSSENTGGSSGGRTMSHAMMGEVWLDKHLAKVGRSKIDLARELWKTRLTAVAELCDDAFEEHVLAYPPHLTGLHLHGLNRNTTTLHSLPSSRVQAFATEWGMIPTPFSVFPSVLALRTYCEEVERAGGIEEDNGTIVPVEGFVIRGRKRRSTSSSSLCSPSPTLSPLSTSLTLDSESDDVEPFFWKVKFVEPYLTYRAWRELTRNLLANADLERPKPFSAMKKFQNAPMTALYAWWVDREIRERRSKFNAWESGRGIIATREEFLGWSNTTEGRDKKRELGIRFVEVDRVYERTLIVPIAIPGCGKTSLGVSLAHLFDWGHTQNDDFCFKRPGPHFIKSVQTLLNEKEVVYADKNNHLISLRSDLLKASLTLNPRRQVRLIALHWPMSSSTVPQDVVKSICDARIIERGQNHQTLRAGEDHLGILSRFMGAVQEYGGMTDVDFEEVLEMDLRWNREETLRRTLEMLVRVISIEMPNDERIKEALRVAREYEPELKRDLISVEGKKKAVEKRAKNKPRYYGLAVEIDLKTVLHDLFHSTTQERTMVDTTMFDLLNSSNRIEASPHITLVHDLERQSTDIALQALATGLWERCSTILSQDEVDDSYAVELTLGPTLAYDNRVMSLQVSAISSNATREEDRIELRKDGAHVTVGTISAEVRPVEGKWLMEKALAGEKETALGGEIRMVEIGVIKCRGRLAGMR